MALMETDLFTQTDQRKVKWLLEHLGVLWIMGETANISDKTFEKRRDTPRAD